MVVLAVVVFAALQYFKAGYGYLRSKGWGPMIDNKLGWVLMEIPVLIVTDRSSLSTTSSAHSSTLSL